uniref:Uncharacterized protein n=1 Tax=Arundo donax TaxID=35708 RepID=A0A0A9CKI7_ARUDO
MPAASARMWSRYEGSSLSRSPRRMRSVNRRFSSGSGRHEKPGPWRGATTCSHVTAAPRKESTTRSLAASPKVKEEALSGRERLSRAPAAGAAVVLR